MLRLATPQGSAGLPPTSAPSALSALHLEAVAAEQEEQQQQQQQSDSEKRRSQEETEGQETVASGTRPQPALAASKRRASSLSDMFSRRGDASPSAAAAKAKARLARSAVANAFQTVSSSTTRRFAKLRSSSDNFMKKAPGSWKLPTTIKLSSNPIRRPFHASAGAVLGSRVRWKEADKLQHASAVVEYHGEDAGASSDYFHIVADGVSSPFGRGSIADCDGVPVSSAHIAQEVVRCVRVTLEELTNDNRQPLEQSMFESAIVDAIKTARINCFQHRKSRLATTLSVSYFQRWSGRLFTFSLGDSKCLVVRRGAVVYETLAVLREFNVPTVVNLREQVVTKDYVVQSFALQEGDICLTFSDGLGDNLYKDEITSALAAPELWDASAGLQSVCDQLVNMAKVQEKAAEDGKALFPFATAAVLEYRERVLEAAASLDGDGLLDGSGVDHLALSQELVQRHEGKQTLDRHLLLRKASRKRHYSLSQLKLMAEMQTKKPDDITLFMTRFV